MKHYVYKITDPDTKEFYIGSRSFDGPMNKDSYMGSYVTWSPDNEERLIKENIRSDFQTREEAFDYESKLIQAHIHEKLNRNYYIPHKGFSMYGAVGPWAGKKRKNMQGVNHPLYGVERTWMQGKNHPNFGHEAYNTKPIHQYDLTGKFINSWSSIHKAAKQTETAYTSIIDCAANRIKRAGQFMWRYEKINSINPTKHKHCKSVLQYTLSGEFVKKWPSMKSVKETYTNIYPQNISKCCRNIINSTGGFIWKYDLSI